MANFDSARLKHISKAKELENLLSFYSYSNKADAARTEERLKELLVKNLRDSKGAIFNVIQFVFEIQEDKTLDRIFVPLRDEIDILNDEVKVSHIDWKDLPERFWELVIAHDLTLVDGSTNLTELAAQMEKLVSSYKKSGDGKIFDEKGIGRTKKNMESLLDGLRRAFNERDAIFRLSEIDLNQDFEKVRKKIKESI